MDIMYSASFLSSWPCNFQKHCDKLLLFSTLATNQPRAPSDLETILDVKSFENQKSEATEAFSFQLCIQFNMRRKWDGSSMDQLC